MLLIGSDGLLKSLDPRLQRHEREFASVLAQDERQFRQRQAVLGTEVIGRLGCLIRQGETGDRLRHEIHGDDVHRGQALWNAADLMAGRKEAQHEPIGDTVRTCIGREDPGRAADRHHESPRPRLQHHGIGHPFRLGIADGQGLGMLQRLALAEPPPRLQLCLQHADAGKMQDPLGAACGRQGEDRPAPLDIEQPQRGIGLEEVDGCSRVDDDSHLRRQIRINRLGDSHSRQSEIGGQADDALGNQAWGEPEAPQMPLEPSLGLLRSPASRQWIRADVRAISSRTI